MVSMRPILTSVATAGLLLQCGSPVFAQQGQQGQRGEDNFTIHVNTDLVLVNVIARDKKGNLIKGLRREDFTLYEDGKKQQISSFDFENTEPLETAGPAEATVTGAAGSAAILKAANKGPIDVKDRRLILLFFDFSAMEPEQVDRSVKAARDFVQAKMQPADLIAIVSLATNLHVDQDFTDDKTKLLSTLNSYASGEGQGFENGDTGTAEGATETSGSFSVDDTDYNTFSADRKLEALQALMKSLGVIPQKKNIIYFSNGISQSGVDNQSTLRATTTSALKANVSIYTVDIRGLQALPPGGEAQSASLHGRSAYSGQSVLSDFSNNAASQDTLSTLSEDTGGKAFLDSNDFGGVFTQVQKDTSAYYVLGFTSTNPAKNGRFRRLKVSVNRPDLKLEFRNGYYAGRDFQHSNRADREQQLDDELASDAPATDVRVFAGTAYFRVDDSHYYLAVSLVVPGSQIPFVTEKNKDNATIDIIGEVREGGRFPVGQLRDTVKLAVDTSQEVRRKNVQYNTGFVLAPGNYHLKFIFRENQTGQIGAFETDVQIPDLRKAPLKMSSVVLSNQRVPATGKKKGPHPLVDGDTELVPNVTHVFTRDQHLYLQYEVYDPARNKKAEEKPASGTSATGKSEKDAVRVLTSIEFLQGGEKVYESKPIVAHQITSPDRKAIVFQMDLPLQSLKPGFYTCQVNVIDDVAGDYAFPRWPILVKAAAPAGSAAQAASGGR
jgi:VWFA-related protein